MAGWLQHALFPDMAARLSIGRCGKCQTCDIHSLPWVCCCGLVAKLYLTLQPHGLEPTKLLCLWNFPGKNAGVGCHFLPQGIFLTQESNLCLLHWKAGSLPLSHQGCNPIVSGGGADGNAEEGGGPAERRSAVRGLSACTWPQPRTQHPRAVRLPHAGTGAALASGCPGTRSAC